MDTSSSESDSYGRRVQRPRGREAHSRHGGDRVRSPARGGSDRTGAISEKISTLANTLQDTSRNLTKVDYMLGQYRDHTDDQAETMATLRENLEESISQLQSQRVGRSNGASASASTLHSSDLDADSGSDGQRFYPTSPLKDYTSTPRSRRRSRSASVHFKDTSQTADDIHSMHQSLRDLHCDQQRLSHDLGREILRRNRNDIETRRAMESLAGHVPSSQRKASASSRVEQRLQELEREMDTEQCNMRRARRPDQRATMSDELQETSGRRLVQDHQDHHHHHHGRQEAMTARLLTAEREKSEMNQELENARRLLEQSEEGRETLVQQVEGLRGDLLKVRKEKTRLQKAQSVGQTHGSHIDREEGRGGQQDLSIDPLDLAKEVAELRLQLQTASVLSEVEDLKKALDRKERERVQLSIQVEELSSDRARREQQQLRMLEQLREIQSRGQAERREADALLQESTRTRDELKTRAQEAVHRWRTRCRRLQKELEDAQARAQFLTDKGLQAAKEKESSQTQLKVLSHQTESARRELADILGRLAHREEELNRKEVELSEIRQRQMSAEQEIREVREASTALEEENRRRFTIQTRLEEEKQRLDQRADNQARRHQKDEDTQAELQATLKQMTSAHAQLAQRLVEEESSKKTHQKGALELQAKLAAVQEERALLGQQLQLEREVHQKELHNMKVTMEESRTKKDREVQDMLNLCQQERDESQRERMKEVEADAASSKELCGLLQVKLDRMKDECDKLVAQLGMKDEAHSLLHRKYQLLKQEVMSSEQRLSSQSELVKLEEKVLRMEAEQETVLTSMGEELDAACRRLARNGEDKLQAISQKPGLVKDPHRWLAETKTKLRWLCEEVTESKKREQSLRKQHHQTRDQLSALRQSRDSEQTALLQRLDQQETLLRSVSTEKRELLERSRRREEEMRTLQDRILDLETNTRVALDHLEAIPEKQCLMENFEHLEESQRQRETVEQRYTKYKEIVCDLQQQLEESKRRIQEYREEKLEATSRSLRLAALSSSMKDKSTILCSPLRSGTLSPPKRLTSADLNDSTFNGYKPLPD
ncbi:centrosomal protein of 128 kDa [Brachionichthys hirsutus]|uniref:centrosomal protein of 128 kDa n=1 Tax=Brachionichthys hirsutus TaxID=412623 RepID=UPI0036044002